MANPVLSLRGVTKRFGGLVAVNAMDFDVAEREVVGLLGPNGSGKSTTLNLVSGALPLSSRSVSLWGNRISGLPAHAITRKGVSRTFQLVRLLPSMNVVAGAVFGHQRRWGQDAQDHAEHLLDKVGLGGKGDMALGQLTYFETKRVELARTLASDPKVLLLDECLAGLNPTELQIEITLIKSLRDEGSTIILVQHVMDAIRSPCDRCVVMAAGTKIAQGTPTEVLSDIEVIRAYLGDDDA
jgi:branched-chain amino acid transport system ATP-binding protein